MKISFLFLLVLATVPKTFLCSFDNLFSVSGWDYMFTMMNDLERNQKFCEAIRKGVHYNDTVLDLGAGLGLLTMTARKTGARVIAIEHIPETFKLLEAILESNGFSSDPQLEIHRVHSDTVKMSKPVSVVVSETLDNFMTGEHFVLSLKRLWHNNFVDENTRFIPQTGTVYFTLVQNRRGDLAREYDRVGFSQSIADRLRDNSHGAEIRNFRVLSNTIGAFSFDFRRREPLLDSEYHLRELSFKALESGFVSGALVWWDVELDNELFITNDFHRNDSHWGLFFIPVPEGRYLREGDEANLLVATDEATYFIDYLDRLQHRVDLPPFIFVKSDCTRSVLNLHLVKRSDSHELEESSVFIARIYPYRTQILTPSTHKYALGDKLLMTDGDGNFLIERPITATETSEEFTFEYAFCMNKGA